MAVAPSYQDLIDVGQAEAQSRRPDLKFREGDVCTAFSHLGAAMADAVVAYAFQAVADTYFGLARGTALDTIIVDKTGLPRNEASAARGTVHIARADAGAGAGTIYAGTVIASEFDSEGKQVLVALTGDVVVPGTSFDIFAEAEALEAGVAGNAQASTLVRWQDEIFDSSITVINDTEADLLSPADFDGGNEAESDDDYRLRGVSAWLTQRRGTLAALEQGALTVAGVASAIATEDLDTGIVTVSVADQQGNSNQAMLAAVLDALDEWRAAGTLVVVEGGLAAVVDLAIVIEQADASFDVTTAAPAIIASVGALFAKLRRNETAYLDAIKAAVISPYSESIKKVGFASITITIQGSATGLPTTLDITQPSYTLKAGTITVQ